MQELMLFDEITTEQNAQFGYGVSSRMVRDALDIFKDDEVVLWVNSPGGVATEGLAMGDAIEQHGRVTVRGTGLIASAATLLFPRAYRAESTETARWMIHEAAIDPGHVTQSELGMLGDYAAKLNKQIAEQYAKRGKQTAAAYLKRMTPGVYLDTSEVLDDNQIDAIYTPAKGGDGAAAVARFDPKRHAWLKDAPADLVALASFDRPWAGKAKAAADVLCGKFGCPVGAEFSNRFKAGCSCKPLGRFVNSNRGPTDAKNGQSLASVLNNGIDEMVTDDLTRSDIISRMADAAGIESGTVNQILDTSIDCPPLDRLRGFASVLRGVTLGQLRDAAERDGCNYDDASNKTAGADGDLQAAELQFFELFGKGL